MSQSNSDTSRRAGVDNALRQSMKNALAQPDAQGLDALQSRVMAQWEQRTASHTSMGHGPVASLRQALAKRPLQMGLASLAIVAAVAIQTSWPPTDHALDDLMEPDVLSLITLGEL